MRYATFAVFIVLCTGGYVLYQKTVITWWWPVAVAMAVAGITVRSLYGKWSVLTTSGNRTLNILCHFFAVGSVAYFAILGINYFFADAGTRHTEEVRVIDKSIRKHQKYRAVGRRRRVADGTYSNYYICVEFADGTGKEIPVTHAFYSRARKGATTVLEIQKGFFGIMVIKSYSSKSTYSPSLS